MAAEGQGLIPPGVGESVALGGLGAVFKLSGKDTGGAFAVVEHPLAPGASGSAAYPRLRGRDLARARRGGQRAGRARSVPGGTGRLRGETAGRAARLLERRFGAGRIREIIAPTGFERYFREVAAVLAPGGPPDFARLAEIAARYGLTLHMERLAEVEQAHVVRL